MELRGAFQRIKESFTKYPQPTPLAQNATKAQKREYQSQVKQADTINTQRGITRRNVLVGAGGTAALATAAITLGPRVIDSLANRPHSTPLSPEESNQEFVNSFFQDEAQLIILGNPPQIFEDPKPAERLDTAALKALFENLTQEKGDRAKRLIAIKNNTVLLLSTAAGGTALKIGENGIYITAAHTLTEGAQGKKILHAPTTVADPKTGISTPVTRYIADLERDIAILFAPNGKKATPVENIQIDTAIQLKDSPLWLFGLQKKDDNFGLLVDKGPVVPKPEDFVNPFKDTQFIGMATEYPGASGGAIVTENGKVTGIYLGAISRSNNDGPEIRISRVTPIGAFLHLVEKPSTPLPIK